MDNAGAEANLDGFITAAGAVAPPGATIRGSAEEALLEGAEYGAEAEEAAKASEAKVTAATRVRPPRPADWGDMSRRQQRNWKLRAGRPR